MAKILLSISIIITLLTAVLGFMTKGKVDGLQEVLSTTKNTLASTKSKLQKTETDLVSRTTELETATTRVKEQAEQIATVTTERDTTKTALDAATAQVAAKEMEVAKLTEDLRVAMAPPTENAPKPAFVMELESMLAKSQSELAESKQVQETLNNRVRDAEEKSSGLQTQVTRYRDNIVSVALSGRVLAYNPGWNFVVLDVGDRQGAAVNALMTVMRGSQVIGRLRITSVEPATSIADVVPGSMGRGVSIQPGDRVIFAGRQAGQTGQPTVGGPKPTPSVPAVPTSPEPGVPAP